jgi:hypothetical protein
MVNQYAAPIIVDRRRFIFYTARLLPRPGAALLAIAQGAAVEDSAPISRRAHKQQTVINS